MAPPLHPQGARLNMVAVSYPKPLRLFLRDDAFVNGALELVLQVRGL